MIALPVVLLALYTACSTALSAGLVGAAAFLAWVAAPLARRLPEEQARQLTDRAVSWLRLTAGLALLDLLFKAVPLLWIGGEVSWLLVANWVAGFLLPLGVFVVAGTTPWRARLSALGVALYMALNLIPAPDESSGLLVLCVTLAIAGLGFCLGSLPPLRRLLDAPWPASVAQAVGARHFALILPGLGLIAVSLALAWPHREVFLEERGLPTTALTATLALLALLAAAARGAMLLLAGRPGRTAGWLAPLRAMVEVELILGVLLSAALVPLASLPLPRHLTWPSDELMLYGPGIAGYAGGLLVAMAALAFVQASDGPRWTRYRSLLLLPLAALLVWGIEGPMGQAFAVLLVIAALSELARLLGGSPRLALAPSLLTVLALVLLLVSIPFVSEGRLAGIALLGLVARWLALRLPPSRAARLAGLLHALLLGAFGLMLLLPYVR